jgi:hypothetical protein
MSTTSLPRDETLDASGSLPRRAIDILAGATELVGDHLGIAPEKIAGKRKGSPGVAFARQVVAYLLHTEAQLDKQQVGRMLQRHRSTIGHAIEVIEDRRDDGVLSSALDAIAARFRAVLPTQAPTPAPLSRRLSDPFVSDLVGTLTEGGLYGDADSVELDRTEDTMSVHVMLKAQTTFAQTLEAERASLTKNVLMEMGRAAGWWPRFSDALWCERGSKGWRVTCKFRRQSAP